MDVKRNVYLLYITSQKDILSVQRNYFADLYKKKASGVNMVAKTDHFIKDSSIQRISEKQRKSCERALSESEVLSVLKQMKTGSTPGSRGITVEFLKVFWSHLGIFVTASFNSAFENGKMSSSQCKELPRNELKNWRSISLTNSDYKLLAKCIALRLSRVTGDIVNSGQVG